MLATMQLTPVAAYAACALLLAGMVAAQPPFPPPGVNRKCSAALTRMANTSTVPAQPLPCPTCSTCPTGQTFCPNTVYSKQMQCAGEPYGKCPPLGMLSVFNWWVEHIPDYAGTPTSCIPNKSTKPGVVCNAPCIDADMDNGNYVDMCHQQNGNDMQKNIDLVWGTEFTCKDGAGKATPCLMHTEVIACMPADCPASDIALVGAMETKALCATLAPYNLSSCTVKYVSDNV